MRVTPLAAQVLPEPGPPVKTRFFQVGRVTAVPTWRRAYSTRRTAIGPASCSLTVSRPGRLASPPMSCPRSLSSLEVPFNASPSRPTFSANPGVRLAALVP